MTTVIQVIIAATGKDEPGRAVFGTEKIYSGGTHMKKLVYITLVLSEVLEEYVAEPFGLFDLSLRIGQRLPAL